MDFRVVDLITPDSKGRCILKWDTFNTAVLDTALWQRLFTEPELAIRLEDIDILTHDGIIWVGFICLQRRHAGHFTYVYLPEQRNQIEFLKYIGFHWLQTPLGFSFANDYLLNPSQCTYGRNRRRLSGGAHELQFVTWDTWSRVASQAAGEIQTFVIELLGVRRFGEEMFRRVQPFGGTLMELIHNIVLHAAAEEGKGVGLVAYTPPPRNYPIMRFCCCDIGSGIRATLKRTSGAEISDDTNAIVKALLLRYFHARDGIAGLYRTMHYVYERFGCLGIRTGNTLAVLDLSKAWLRERFDRGYEEPNETWLKSLLQFQKRPTLPGTHLFVDLRVDNR